MIGPRATLVLGACVLSFAAMGQPQAGRFDLILRGGTIVDGTGAPPVRGDVAIGGRSIARVGNLAGSTAGIEIDVTGLYVTPGFINLHSHATAGALASAENMLTQGVTTEILNPDGGGRLDIAQQLADASASGLALNVGANIGFNSAWASVVGETDRRPTRDEIQKMQELLVANLERGAWGVSAGLDYKPAYFSTTEEVVDVVRAAAPWRTNFTNHDRLTPEAQYSSRVGMTETMAIGARAGLVPVITHMKVQGREQGTAARFLRTMSEASAQGRYTAADAYPYLAGQSGLGALIIPGWAQDGGREKMLERFKDPATRAKIVAEAEDAMAARFGGPQGVYMPASKRELTDVMKELGVSGGEAIVRVLEEQNAGAILRFGAEADLIRILQHPTTSVACDCGAVLPGRASHPRYYGTFPRVLGHYVRETKALTWPDAIRKMTLLPAATIGMIDRGAIAPGMAADLAVFDPNRVIDHATFEEPTLPSDGIRHVVVNGQLALRDGTPTGVKSGMVLSRSKHMPSRAMNGLQARAVKAAGSIAADPSIGVTGYRVSIDLRQSTGPATGKFSIVDAAGTAAIESVSVGVLQTSVEWASFTARARMQPGGEERSVVVVIEARDPWVAERPATITVSVDGVVDPKFSGRLPAGSVRIDSRR